MYDAVAEAVPMADQGTNRKKAVLVISDGNDTNSETHISEVKQLVRETEVLVYAIGIDGEGDVTGIFGGRRSSRRGPRSGTVAVPDPTPRKTVSGAAGGGGGGRGARAPGIARTIG